MSLPPSGEIPQGAIRFNTDSQRLEFYAQGEWWVMSTDTPNLGTQRPGVSYSSGSQVTGSAGLTGEDNLFNGLVGQYADTGYYAKVDLSNDNFILWTPTSAISYSSKVEIYCYAANGYSITNTYSLNGGSEVSFTGGSAGFNDATWITVATGSGTINSLKVRLQRSGSASQVNWYAIRIDGTILTNVSGAIDSTPGARGLLFGGQSPSNITQIDGFNIASAGDAFDFGDLNAHSRYTGSTSSSTLAVTAGGVSAVTTIERTIFSSQGTSVNHGNLSLGRYGHAAVSNGSRAVFIGGFKSPSPNGPLDTIDYITISSGGTAESFGTLTDSKNYMGACASPVRGVFAGGTPVASPYTPLTTDIEFVTTATLGSEQDFGSLTAATSGMSGLSNPTRGIFAGGYNPAANKVIQYITIASSGNAINFGDLVNDASASSNSGASSSTRGVFSALTPGQTTNMDMIEIATQGNAVDFGNLDEGRNNASAASNAHGGL